MRLDNNNNNDDNNDDDGDGDGGGGGGGVCKGEILGGRRRSILEVAGAIRTGVRLGSITKDTANKSKWSIFVISEHLSLISSITLGPQAPEN